MATEELLARGMTALDKRIAKARTGTYRVTAKADKLFAVTNGEGGPYEADFSEKSTGVCNCPDFTSCGKYLHACIHTAATVLDQWPIAFDRWESKARALACTSIAQLHGETEVESAAVSSAQPPDGMAETCPTAWPATAAGRSAACDEQLVTAIVHATLPLVMARVLEAIEESAPEMTRQVLADVAFAAQSSAS